MKAVLTIITLLVLQQLPPARAPQAAPNATIRGIVVNERNEPVAGAVVEALWEPRPAAYRPEDIPQSSTNSDGRFAIEKVTAGGYRVHVRRLAGYAAQWYGASRSGNGAEPEAVTLHLDGGTTQEIVIRLTAEGVISGRVIASTGQPLLGMEVHVLRRAYNAQGWMFYLPENDLIVTNDRGEYRVTGIPVGNYTVRAQGPFVSRVLAEERRANFEGRPRPAPPSPGLYASTYYGGVTDPGRAVLVAVEPGRTTENIDITLQPEVGHHIRGYIKAPNDAHLSQPVSFMMMPADSVFLSGLTLGLSGDDHYDQATGAFQIDNVPSGVYWVIADLDPVGFGRRRRAEEAAGRDTTDMVLPPRGRVKVTIAHADAENVTVTLIPRTVTLQGTLVVDGSMAASATLPSTLKLELRPIEANRPGPPLGRFTRGADGNFAFTNLVTGEYRLAVVGLPDNAYVKTAQLGSIDLMTSTFNIEREIIDQPLVIDIGTNSGQIDGIVNNAAGVAPSSTVVLIPSNTNRTDFYKTAIADGSGRFAIRGIAPGDYKLLAWEHIETFRYFDPEFVKQVEDRARLLHVDALSTTTVSISTIP